MTGRQAVAWVATGTELFLRALDDLTDAELDAGTALPGWTRRHLLAHVASNAEALGRLISWARTGMESRMYASPEQRDADIGSGATRSPAELRSWVRDSARDLDEAFTTIPGEAWQAEVVTAQGRTVPAHEVPWMRAREVCVHAVDLGTGLTFADLPGAFRTALVDDIVRWRATRDGPRLALTATDTAREWHIGGNGAPHRVALSTADLAAWLTGRLARPELPSLPRWL